MTATLVLGLAAAASILAPGEVSTARSEYNYTVSRDGSVAVFARSDAEFAKAKILVQRGGKAPELISFSDPRYSDTDPQISPDGRGLLFISDRPVSGEGPAGDLNVWRSSFVDGQWSAPEPVLRAVSPGVELGPESHGGALTFNSTRKGGPGGLDIWSMPLDGDAAPQPLPSPINSPRNEGDFTLSRDGRVALFWSDRPGGQGSGDIWMSVRDGEAWSAPENLGPVVNGPGFDFTPSISADDRTLRFARIAAGAHMADVFTIPIAKVPSLARALGAAR